MPNGTGGGDVGTSGGGSTSTSASASGGGRRGGMPPMTTPHATRSSAGSPPFPRPSNPTNHPNPSNSLPSSSSSSLPHPLYPRPPHRQRSRQHSRKPYQHTPSTSNPNPQQRIVHSLDRGNQISPGSTDENALDSSRSQGRSQARKHSSGGRSHPTSATFTSAARAAEFVDTGAETEQEFAEAARSRMVMQSSLLQGIKKNKLHPTLLTRLTLHHYQFRMDEWIEMMLLLPALQELDLDIASVVSVSVPTSFQEQETQHQHAHMEMEVDEATSERRPNSFWRRSRCTSSSGSYNSPDEMMDTPEQQPLSSVFQFHSIRSLTFRGDKILPQLLEFLPNLQVLAFEEAQGVQYGTTSSHKSNTNQRRQRTSAQGVQSNSESDSSTMNGGNTNSPTHASAVFVQLANTILERCPRLSRLVLNDPLMLVSANCDSDDSSLDIPQRLVPMQLFQNADNTAGAILAFSHTRRQNHELEYQLQREQIWHQQLVQEQIQQDIALLFRAVPKLRSFVSHTRVVSLCPGLLDELVAYHSSHLVSFQILDGQNRRLDIPQSHRPPHHHPQQQQQQQQQHQSHVQPQQQPHSTDDTYYNPTRLSPPSDSLSLSPSPPPPLLPSSSSQPLPIPPHAHAHHTDMPEPPYFPYEAQQQEALLYPQQYFHYEADAMSQSSGSLPLESAMAPAPMQYYDLTPFQVHLFQLQTYSLQQQQQQQFMILQQQQQQERQMQHQRHIQTLLCKSVLHVLESCPVLACFDAWIALPLQQIVDSVPSWLCRGTLQSLQLNIRELVGEGREDGGGGLDSEEEEVMQLFVKSLFMGRNSMNNKQSKESSLSSISSPSSTYSTPLIGDTDKRGGRASALSPAMTQSSASDSTSSFDSAISSSTSSLKVVKGKRPSLSSNEPLSSTPPPLSSPSISPGTVTTTTDISSMKNSLQRPPRQRSNSSRFRDDSGNDSGSDAMMVPKSVGVSSYQISSVERLVGLQYLVEHQLTTLPRLKMFSLGNHEYRIPPSCRVRSQTNAV
ncbi:hypothetical protein BGZ82_002990 [Podila clonocystis]|nr:hypothetical protein BGZ82_002990 [Podila clonocystis]